MAMDANGQINGQSTPNENGSRLKSEAPRAPRQGGTSEQEKLPKWLSAVRRDGDADKGSSEFRSPFLRDYGALIHSAPFRRLAHKTQVILNPRHDFPRTRLTHSIEVSQIARELARAFAYYLELPAKTAAAVEDTAAAASLAHDVGQPPFGHCTEKQLNLLVKAFGGFDANRQNIRILCKNFARPGMNLTAAVLDSIMKYKSGPKSPAWYEDDRTRCLWAAEACGTEKRRNPICYLMDAADDIAYISGDIEDALKGDLVPDDLIINALESTGITGFDDSGNKIKHKAWGDTVRKAKQSDDIDSVKSAIIKGLVRHVLAHMIEIGSKAKEESTTDALPAILEQHFRSSGLLGREAEDSPNNNVAENLKTAVYTDLILKSAIVSEAEYAAERLIDGLWKELTGLLESSLTPKARKLLRTLPINFQICQRDNRRFEHLEEQEKMRLLADYIAGMTDRHAIRVSERLSGREVLVG